MKDGLYEYRMTIIKFSVFAKFFKEADEGYLQDSYCDLAFVKFMHRGSLTRSHTCQYLEESEVKEFKEKNNYMYYYTGQGSERQRIPLCDKVAARIFLSVRLMENYPENLDQEKLDLNKKDFQRNFTFKLKRSISIDDIKEIKRDIDKIDYIITDLSEACRARSDCSLPHERMFPDEEMCKICRTRYYCSVCCARI